MCTGLLVKLTIHHSITLPKLMATVLSLSTSFGKQREELQRVEHELREARHVERILRDDLTAG
jgi:hypothetical protein